MNVIRIRIAGAVFLLPDTHNDYAFPGYIIEHRELIAGAVELGQEVLAAPLDVHGAELSEALKALKLRTGIIGFPFDLRDADLYALNRQLNVVLDVEL